MDPWMDRRMTEPVTVIDRSKPALSPPAFVAVTVYVAATEATCGVPVMCPVDTSIAKPVGRLGETENELGAPPDVVGELVLIATPTG